jgi:peptidoglycan/LPS O-acetylase OafA/YrhL
MQLIGNVSFGGYLYHFTVIMLRLNSQSTMPSYKFYDLFGAWFSDIIYTLILATASTLLIELPVQNMWRVGLEGKLMEKLKVYVNGPKKERNSSGDKSRGASKAQNLPEEAKNIGKNNSDVAT